MTFCEPGLSVSLDHFLLGAMFCQLVMRLMVGAAVSGATKRRGTGRSRLGCREEHIALRGGRHGADFEETLWHADIGCAIPARPHARRKELFVLWCPKCLRCPECSNSRFPFRPGSSAVSRAPLEETFVTTAARKEMAECRPPWRPADSSEV